MDFSSFVCPGCLAWFNIGEGGGGGGGGGGGVENDTYNNVDSI